MSIPKSQHKVYMFTNDFNAMRAEVYKHQHIETGGNLFGLWTTSGSAVIHVVLGHGRFVNDDYMLCRIGEWHQSHHRLSLNKPSAREEQSVKRNFPQGMSKFLVIVANINHGDSVLSPYFFTDGGTRYEKAEFVVLESKNPFSNDAKILAKIERGVEGNHGGASLTGSETPRNTGSNSHQNDNTSPTYSQVTATIGQPSGENASCVTSMEISDTKSPEGEPNPPADHTSAQTTGNPPENSTIQNQTANTEDDKATTKEIIMKDTYDELEKFFGQGKVKIERTSHDDINMIFEHESYHWMVRFPENFPNQPAQLYRASKRHHFPSSSPCPHYNLENPLTNHVNILLSIKKNCRLTCKICENISKEKLTKCAAAVSPVNTKFADVVKELANEIKMTDMATPLSFSGLSQSDGSYRIEFDHYCSKWSIEIPAGFPDKPAEVYKQESRYLAPQKKTINDSSKSRNEQKSLVSSDLIMLAIRSNCYCSPCWDSSSCKQLRN